MDRMRTDLNEIAPQAVFEGVVHTVGEDIISDLFGRAEANPGGRGATLGIPAKQVVITVRPPEVSFRNGSWGPYTLSIEAARTILGEMTRLDGQQSES